MYLFLGQKKSKKRRSKKPTKDKSDKGEDESRSGDNLDTGQRQQQGHQDQGQTTGESQQSINTSGRGKPEDDLPAWSKISSSESEWSDTEGGQTSRLRSNCTKVRQCALSCFYWIVKVGIDFALVCEVCHFLCFMHAKFIQ